MQEVEINVSGRQHRKEIEEIIETACRVQNLHLASKNTLQKYPGCVHWHYQRIKTTGTLEITYWPAQNRCWFPIRNGRAKPWVIGIMKQLKVEIERHLKVVTLSDSEGSQDPTVRDSSVAKSAPSE